MQQRRQADADQGGDVGHQVHRVVGAVARHGDGICLLQHLSLSPHQNDGESQGDEHDRKRPGLFLERLGGDQMTDGFLADQGGGSEHQARLQEAGEGLALPMAEAVLAIGGRRGVAHGNEGPQRGDDVETGVGQGGQSRHRARGEPGAELQHG